VDTEQNVGLLRDGVILVRNDTHAVTVAGGDESRVTEVVARVLGEDVEIDLVGNIAREIRPRTCLAYREREPRRLQLRIVLQRDEHVDELVFAEDDETVVVYATVCTAIDGEEGDECDVPHHLWLERPLGDRVVVDGTNGRRLEARPAPVN
jgi:hypothetical protein